MFSESMREALEGEVVGQPAAVHSVVRGVTRLAGSVTPAERSWCAYLLVGPTGTGRGHLVRSVARTMLGHEAVLTVHCTAGVNVDPWADFLRRLQPLATPQSGAPAGWNAGPREPRAPTPPRLVLVKDLERAHKDLFPQVAHLLESGQEILPEGCLSLDGCMFFFTTSLCSDEILDQSRLGFGASTGNGNEDALHRICHEKAESAFGREFLGQLDDLIVFQQLNQENLTHVLERHFARMERWLESRGVRATLEPTALRFLMGSEEGDKPAGATHLIRVHREEVEFPIADMLLSGAVQPGDTVTIDHRAEERHLHFDVTPGGEGEPGTHEIPVVGAR